MIFHVSWKTAKLLQTIRLTILNVVLDTGKARNMDMESTSNHCQKKASEKYGTGCQHGTNKSKSVRWILEFSLRVPYWSSQL